MPSPSPPPPTRRTLVARKLSIPKPFHAQSPHISSLQYDPFSKSLALRHSDSSFSLYPNFTPLSTPSFPTPQPPIPSPTSSSTFLHLQPTNSTLFITSSPVIRPSSTLLRFQILRSDRFSRIRVFSTHKDLDYDSAKAGIVFKVNHGVSMRLCGGINVFGLYSVSNCKIWIFSVRLIRDDVGGEGLKLIKCAVIDCCFCIFEIKVLFGFLVLGEENGVRLFPIRPLVKGKKKKNSSKRILNYGMDSYGDLKVASTKGEKNEKHSDSLKLKALKLRQDSSDTGAIFVAFKDEERSASVKMVENSVKAVSIQALSANKFVILDSVGDIHLLRLSSPVNGSFSPYCLHHLTQTMKVQKLTVFHDVSAETRAIWLSDGSYTIHLMMVCELDTSIDTEKKDNGEEFLQTSVIQTIFSGENIQDVVPLAAEAILMLGQGSLIAYAIF